jgi:hypothetical protein
MKPVRSKAFCTISPLVCVVAAGVVASGFVHADVLGRVILVFGTWCGLSVPIAVFLGRFISHSTGADRPCASSSEYGCPSLPEAPRPLDIIAFHTLDPESISASMSHRMELSPLAEAA